MPSFRAASGIEWYYEIKGEGEYLLFLHGWGVDGGIWRRQREYFSLSFRVICVDWPGHGQSSWRKVSLKQLALDLKELLGHLQVNRLSVVASSMGGLLALRLYQLIDSKIRRMIFVGSIPKFARSRDNPCGLDGERIAKLTSQLEGAYPAMVHIFFRSLFTRYERQSSYYHDLQKLRERDPLPRKQALVEYLDILAKEDLRKTLQGIKAPIFYMSGADDEICTKEAVMSLQKLLPRARFHFFKRCGHYPFVSEPNEFNKVLKKFLDADDAPRLGGAGINANLKNKKIGTRINTNKTNYTNKIF